MTNNTNWKPLSKLDMTVGGRDVLVGGYIPKELTRLMSAGSWTSYKARIVGDGVHIIDHRDGEKEVGFEKHMTHFIDITPPEKAEQ